MTILWAAIVAFGIAFAVVDGEAGNPSEYTESLRPQFHFTAAKNWINDPNGLVYCDGVYHLFFQYNPHGRESANKSWGHAVSRDLVHWTQRETALYPDEHGEVWSGSAVVDEQNTSGFQRGTAKPIVLIYTAAGGFTKETAGKRFTQCLAHSADGGNTWAKYDKNPVLGHVRGQNRDPKVTWHAPSKRWAMALYVDGHDFALFTSPDLKTWTKLQEFTVEGTDECPDFFPMPIEGEPGKTAWVWMAANGRYLVGEFDGQTFKPERGFDALRSEYGRGFYAGQTFSGMPDSRRVQIAWLRDGNFPGMPFNQQLTFPTTLTLHRTPGGLRVYRSPVKEIELLHDVVAKRADAPLSGAGVALGELSSDLLDIDAVIEVGSAKRVGLRVRGEVVSFDVGNKALTCPQASAPLELKDGRIRLRVLVDRTSIEVFANDGAVSLSSSYLPGERAGAEAPTFFADDGNARLVSCEGHTLKSAWRK